MWVNIGLVNGLVLSYDISNIMLNSQEFETKENYLAIFTLETKENDLAIWMYTIQVPSV